MAGPPAVTWVVSPAHANHITVFVGLLGGALAIAFYLVLQPWGRASLFLLMLLAGAFCIAARARARQPSGNLIWDGEQWMWSGWEVQANLRVHCVIDLQRWMLLRVHASAGTAIWLWLETREASARWLALRRAVFANIPVQKQRSEPGL